MPLGPGLLISGSFLAGYGYWRFSFRQITSALRLERAGQTEQARVLFESFLANRNPLTRRGESRNRCRLLLARLERKAGRYADAVRVADDLIASGPSAGIALAALQVRADALAWGGHLDAAVTAASKALATAKETRVGNFELELSGLLCRIRTWRGEFDDAGSLAEELIARGGPTAAYGYLRMSEICCGAGDYARAANYARQLLDALRIETNSAELVGSQTNSVERVSPGKAGAAVWTALATLYGARAAFLGEGPAGARDWLQDPEKGRRLPVSDSIGWWGLQALAARQSGRNQAAEQHLSAMRQVSESASSGYGAQAWSLYYDGRHKIAAGHFETAAESIIQAIRAQPPADALPEFYFHLGLALEHAGKPGADGAYTCGGKLPAAFHFARLCRSKVDADRIVHERDDED